MSIRKSKARKLAEFLRNITAEAKLTTEAVQDDKVVTTGSDLDSKSTDTTALVSAASVTSYVGDKLDDYVHSTHDINLTFTGDVTGHGTITDMSHTSFNLTLDAETLPNQSGYAGKFLTTDGTTASWAAIDTTNGDTAYSWGDHAQVGYLTSFTETDPTVPAHVKSITTTDISQWDDAYSWGDHSQEGYLTSETNDYVDSVSFSTSSGILSLGRTGSLPDLTVDLDGRYLQSFTETDTLQSVTARGASTNQNILIEKNNPVLTLSDTNANPSTYPTINFTTTNNQGVSLYYTEFDSELPLNGYGLVLDADSANAQFPDNVGAISLNVLGEVYAGSRELGTLNKVWHAGNLDPDNYLLTSNYVDTTYNVSAVDVSGGKAVRLTGSDGTTDDVKFAAGSNVSLARSGDTITISSTDTNTDTNTTDWYVANSSGGNQFKVDKNENVRFEGTGATSVSFNASNNKITISSTDTNTETTTNLVDNGDNTITYTNEEGTAQTIDLSLYLDDTNLARILSGTMNSSGVATFTRDDSTTFTVDMSVLLDDTNLARIVSAAWNTSNGVLTLTRNDGSTIPVDLDNRYLQSYTETDTLDTVTSRGAVSSRDITISAPDLGSAPATTALLKIQGYEGRGAGIKIKDSANSATGSSQREWFIGSGYSQSGFNIGYSPTGNQSSYLAQSKLRIDTNGNTVISGTVTATSFSGSLNYNDITNPPTIDNSVDYINGASFSTSTGVLTLSGVGRAGASVDLDGRYAASSHVHNYMPIQHSTAYRVMTTTDWGDFNLGNGTMLQASSAGLPSGGTHGYWFVTGKRDVQEGYVGLYFNHYSAASGMWIGKNTDGSAAPTWERVYTDSYHPISWNELSDKPSIPDGNLYVRKSGDTMTGSLTVPGVLKVTETGTAQHFLIGNQDSGGVNKPAMIRGVNGQLQLGHGSSWSGEGGSMTVGLTVEGNEVGIGTSNPGAKLHLYSGGLGANTGVTDMLRIEVNRSDHSTTPSGPAILFKDQDTNNTTNQARIKMMTVNDNDYGDNDEAASNFVFETTNGGVAADKMIITGRGDIGMGTNNPKAPLHVTGNVKVGTTNGSASSTIVSDLDRFLEVAVQDGSGSGQAANYTSGSGIVFHHGGTCTSAIKHLQPDINTAIFRFDSDRANTRLEIKDGNTRLLKGSTHSLRVQTNSGYLDLGPQNTTHCHINTDRGSFYLNKEITVDSGIIGSYNEDLHLRRSRNSAHQIRIAAGTTTISQNTVIQGNLTVNGSISQSDGFGTLYTFNTTQGLSTSWADVSAIAGNALPTGTYAIQIFVNNYDTSPSGGNYSEYYSGIMSWYGSSTNDGDWNEIPLHNAGHAQNGASIFARTLRRPSGQGNLILQLAASGTVGSDGIQIKLRRLI